MALVVRPEIGILHLNLTMSQKYDNQFLVLYKENF